MSDYNPVLASVVQGLDLIGQTVPGLWGTIVRGVAAGVGLVGDLINLGMNPETEIHEIRSSIQSFQAAKDRLEQKLRDKFHQG